MRSSTVTVTRCVKGSIGPFKKAFRADTEGEILIQVPTPSNMTEQEFADAVNQDMDEATCAQLDEEEIVQQVKRQRVETGLNRKRRSGR